MEKKKSKYEKQKAKDAPTVKAWNKAMAKEIAQKERARKGR